MKALNETLQEFEYLFYPPFKLQMPQPDTTDRLEITNPERLAAWLAKNHNQDSCIWIVTYKKAVPDKHVSAGEVLDELLACGWIEGRRMKLEEERTMQLISPRRIAYWSKTYKDRVAKLELEGRLAEPGRAAVERGKAAGLWDFLNNVDTLIQPE